MTVVNLNKFRKAKAQAEKKVKAEENTLKFGRTKAQRSLEEARAEKARRDLDGNERE